MAFGTPTWIGRTAAVAATLLAAVVTCAWVFYADDRVPSHSARIGTLAVDMPEGTATGTAFLVDDCGILTNFHVVFGPWYVTALRPPSHDFVGTFTLTEVELADGSHPTARAIPLVWGDYLGPDRQWRVPGEDWAYLHLVPCLGSRYGYFDLREADGYQPPVDHGFAAVGYSTGRQMTDPSCAARADPSAGSKEWLHDCAVLAGDSGGPMFRGGTLTVVALVSAYRAGPGGGACLSATPGIAQDALARLGNGCANVAVPVTSDMRKKIWDAGVRVSMQKALMRLGYDPGRLGDIEDPKLLSTFRQAQRDRGWPAGDLQQTHEFWAILWMGYQIERAAGGGVGADPPSSFMMTDPAPVPPKP